MSSSVAQGDHRLSPYFSPSTPATSIERRRSTGALEHKAVIDSGKSRRRSFDVLHQPAQAYAPAIVRYPEEPLGRRALVLVPDIDDITPDNILNPRKIEIIVSSPVSDAIDLSRRGEYMYAAKMLMQNSPSAMSEIAVSRARKVLFRDPRACAALFVIYAEALAGLESQRGSLNMPVKQPTPGSLTRTADELMLATSNSWKDRFKLPPGDEFQLEIFSIHEHIAEALDECFTDFSAANKLQRAFAEGAARGILAGALHYLSADSQIQGYQYAYWVKFVTSGILQLGTKAAIIGATHGMAHIPAVAQVFDAIPKTVFDILGDGVANTVLTKRESLSETDQELVHRELEQVIRSEWLKIGAANPSIEIEASYECGYKIVLAMTAANPKVGLVGFLKSQGEAKSTVQKISPSVTMPLRNLLNRARGLYKSAAQNPLSDSESEAAKNFEVLRIALTADREKLENFLNSQSIPDRALGKPDTVSLVLSALRDNKPHFALQTIYPHTSAELRSSVRADDLLSFIELDERVIRYANKEFLESKDFIINAIKKNPRSFIYLRQNLRSDTDYARVALIKDASLARAWDGQWNSDFIAELARLNPEIAVYAKSPVSWAFFEGALKSAIQQNWDHLKDRQKLDNVLFAALRQYPAMLRSFYDEQEPEGMSLDMPTIRRISDIVRHQPFIERLMDIVPEALQFADRKLQGKKKIVLKCVTKKADCISFAVPDLRDDKGFCLDAVAANPAVLRLIMDDPSNFLFHYSAQQRQDFEKRAVRRCYSAYRYAAEETRENQNLLKRVLSKDPGLFNYFPIFGKTVQTLRSEDLNDKSCYETFQAILCGALKANPRVFSHVLDYELQGLYYKDAAYFMKGKPTDLLELIDINPDAIGLMHTSDLTFEFMQRAIKCDPRSLLHAEISKRTQRENHAIAEIALQRADASFVFRKDRLEIRVHAVAFYNPTKIRDLDESERVKVLQKNPKAIEFLAQTEREQVLRASEDKLRGIQN
ncbi:hypothetical protein ASPBRDRAFT_201239 [Aspergillus brasiliensis CBS 101740]|uniref:DUF4116 domain-containing protein n=1 Tax=Aspergillus brasiliensis (strain CBS 101740 / IMI 381727 / IBT 21946) TaxID=767769 RepID=A0A1L9U377_ASPBC|nr:hypothetical protein ASPBRDRAFT_201239 [Aspergillus brasiliensis CBS 101740]